ncbi:PREDICTED: uncharacterized protein LOC109582818 [Amphimedon queenslandica]|uniref:Uncharacterized protein n=1 Tax=Amphimedon queenslandica TaxID=400682 RepID=A0AAN0J9D6_AMPQE|nr:PREDICTED: uncharacterized protein LOC109582818 [Amphimedon queenslandica]|eukprot:XP_019853362.1 PREDICTED: uncharacterized protein LOC109582818 [Amphimedon queenslandica]
MANLNEGPQFKSKIIMNDTILGHRNGEFARLYPLLPDQDQDLQSEREWILTQASNGGFIIHTSTSNDGYHWKFDRDDERVYLESNADYNNMANCAFQFQQNQISPLQCTDLHVCHLQETSSCELTLTEKNNNLTYFQIAS